MSFTTTIKITNLPEIRRAFDKAPRLMNDELKQALTKSAINVEAKSKINTPVATGYLRASHAFKVSGSGLSMKAEIGPTADYAVFVHEGTRFMRGRPFLQEAAESSDWEIQGYFTKAVQNVLDRIGRDV